MKKLITFLLILFSYSSQAQVERTIYQTFEIKDEVQSVSLDVVNEFEIEKWAANNVMAVTVVKMDGGAKHILDFYIGEGRYDLEIEGDETALNLFALDKKRRGVKYKGVVVEENVKIKLHIPENFELKGKSLVRITEPTASTTTGQ